MCASIFHQNFIKIKVCNNLQTKNLEFVVYVAIEDMRDDHGSILVKSIVLWKNSKKLRWLYSHPHKYLSRHVNLEDKDIDFYSYLNVLFYFIFIIYCMFIKIEVIILPCYIIER